MIPEPTEIIEKLWKMKIFTVNRLRVLFFLAVSCFCFLPPIAFGDQTRMSEVRQTSFLLSPDGSQLAPSPQSGIFNIYGSCHELGHIVMYRGMKNQVGLPDGIGEGWAHYAGSVVLDAVAEHLGQKSGRSPTMSSPPKACYGSKIRLNVRIGRNLMQLVKPPKYSTRLRKNMDAKSRELRSHGRFPNNLRVRNLYRCLFGRSTRLPTMRLQVTG